MKWNEFAKQVSQKAPIDKWKSQTGEYALRKAGTFAVTYAEDCNQKVPREEIREDMLKLFTAIALAMECNDYYVTDEEFELSYYKDLTYLYKTASRASRFVLNQVISIFEGMCIEPRSEIFPEMPDISEDTYSIKPDGTYVHGLALKDMLGWVCAGYTDRYQEGRHDCQFTKDGDNRVYTNSIESIFDEIKNYIDIFDVLEI